MEPSSETTSSKYSSSFFVSRDKTVVANLRRRNFPLLVLLPNVRPNETVRLERVVAKVNQRCIPSSLLIVRKYTTLSETSHSRQFSLLLFVVAATSVYERSMVSPTPYQPFSQRHIFHPSLDLLFLHVYPRHSRCFFR